MDKSRMYARKLSQIVNIPAGTIYDDTRWTVKRFRGLLTHEDFLRSLLQQFRRLNREMETNPEDLKEYFNKSTWGYT